MFSVCNGYKKARRACAVRAIGTSSDDSGNHRWRILGWRELNPRPNLCNLLFIINLIYLKIAVYLLRILSSATAVLL